jgi:hypothetical protein
MSHVQTLGHVKEPSSCSSLRAAGKMRMYSLLPSLIEASRAGWCGVPLEMKEGTIPIRSTKGLSTRPKFITQNDDSIPTTIHVQLTTSSIDLVTVTPIKMLTKHANDELLTKKTKLRGLSPRANYTDRAAAASRRS